MHHRGKIHILFSGLKTGMDAVVFLLLWPGLILAQKECPDIKFQSVKHGKKQPTNTRLATADELHTHRRHAHNSPASSSAGDPSLDEGPPWPAASQTTQRVIKNVTLALNLHVTGIIQIRRLIPLSYLSIWSYG